MLKQKAIDMRKEGHTYKEIADHLNVKESWCKYHLKGVDNGSNKYIEDMKDIGVPIGDKLVLLRWDAVGAIYKSFSKVPYEKVAYLLNKAKKHGVVVVPDYTNLNSPTQSYTNLITYSFELKCKVDELVTDYMSTLTVGDYPLPNRKAVQDELLSLVVGGKERLTDKVMRIENTLIEVEELKLLDKMKD